MSKVRVQKDVGTRLLGVLGAWENMRPEKTFYGMTLAQFKERCKAFLDARAESASLELQLSQTAFRRNVAATDLREVVDGVVNSVKGDPTEGQNGELYAAMGYVPKNQRSTGLTRKKAPPPAEGVSS